MHGDVSEVFRRLVTPRAKCVFPVWLIFAVAGQSAALSVRRAKDQVACAPRAVDLALRLVDRETTDAGIRRAFDGRVSGTHSYGEIIDAVASLQLKTRFVRLDPHSPGLTRLPLIVAVKRSTASREADHFVVLYGGNGQWVQVIDYPHMPQWIECSEFAQRWDGRGVYVFAGEAELPGSFVDWVWVPGALIGFAIAAVITSLVLWLRARRARRGV
jgi:ABC-type bacteriocin/lantibiotic exporter with double-glycine peptidase domain